MVLQGAFPLASLYLLKLVIDAITAAARLPSPTSGFPQVAVLLGLLGSVMLASAVCRALAGYVGEAQSQKATDHVSDLLHAKSIEVDLAYYENAKYYDTLHQAQKEASYRPARVVSGLAQAGLGALSLAGMAGLLFSFHWSVAVVLFLASIPGTLVRLKYSNKLFRWYRWRTGDERRAWYLNSLLTTAEHAKELRLFDLGDLLRGRFRDLRAKLRAGRLEIAAGRTVAETLAQTGATLAVFGSYAFIAYRAIQGAITLGDLVMYFQAFQRGMSVLQDFLGSLATLYEDNLFLANLYEFLDLRPQVAEPEKPAPFPRPLRQGIAIDHLTFHYPGGSRPVLDDVSLTLRPGEHVALVGENGSGKTTLVKLLCRLYDPTSGTIAIDGRDLREFATSDLRRAISVVFQDFARYQLTARENIGFGDSRGAPGEARITTAAERSGAHPIIAALPKGYDTFLGKWFEDGEELSIGEWQKVALARAFLREAPIIVLDEPTSALDAKAEFDFYEKFRTVAQGKSAVLISHRFSTVRMADRIYVLDKGRIIESGTHDELLRKQGHYAELFGTQARYYV
ncbi:MAG: ABC transporter ATP-binding protein [Deltaproteobacteria bacterium]|nr:ABC transporter ATP-binding protein [Deltaproteobacteria bacterium]